MQYLIGYDISSPKRLQKIHRRMVAFSTPIQYSVFLYDGDIKGLQKCLIEVLEIFNKKEDDLRVYPLLTGAKQWQLGKAILPEGIIWTALPFNSSLN
ncbi:MULTISPECIES: CRISPR-associated endonuclease Cas2 [Mannheimia]|uniref:CRISPR-associated endoribonuclease Cas2 n=1 Tax=Mannheimia pernigra TaxID=111844 RepID=A0A7D5DX45_9PAST|nr:MULTISPECIES: CRISPR-associated endonuclease Cas2 [Mannheimia]QLB39765.1 CRISPR-associated endonuclease Cas2 [Mannheimia pernigra]QTM01026.1 CRISPR-associated endonuclease Cas2 [Mannheimia sp. ZY171111]